MHVTRQQLPERQVETAVAEVQGAYAPRRHNYQKPHRGGLPARLL